MTIKKQLTTVAECPDKQGGPYFDFILSHFNESIKTRHSKFDILIQRWL